ncbi:MAG: lysine--tRNA ligase [Candidatus Doudnabacteria bacterium CG10_big_fil_rev_8_21_14_0_10_41_10]|uniref:Lysine--tRNA ligase n=1 Tax=Candidatus Doudnabacteria bacterium CG10_big_fil_rev_8_21_14_0_10_41_10 TaxID=1974551 RepID=A0A2H0VDQ9_9BACT|nr:MAG: lysine--tRNA ligase [Candidatus Doudnabacteria bacterium CG10_big_fil_rev_8_21_14_0_10_41_10]
MTEKEKQLYKERLAKLERIIKAGGKAYPAKSFRKNFVMEAVGDFEKFSRTKQQIILAGRIKALRGHGKLVFGDLEDKSGRIQFIVKADEIDENQFQMFKYFDVGDFIEISGSLFSTKQGEKTLQVKTLRLLTKSLRALPEKYSGLQDTEIKLRKRYLDMLANPETREFFRKKTVFWNSVREFMVAEEFLEVENPVLEHVPGGAEAEPFKTHYNALDEDFYLRISLELPLKKLLVGGYEKIFEIGRVFRNEGISAEHLQDYTAMEFYWAYADYEDLQKFLEKFYRAIIKSLFGGLKVNSQGTELDWGKPWKKYDYYELFKKYSDVDLQTATEKELKKKADSLKIKYEPFAKKGRLVDLIYKKTVRPKLVEPGFLLDPPVEIEPLAKRTDYDSWRVQRLQVMAWGTELGKGFSELNDPIDQKKRFEDQMKLREAGDKEAQILDSDFVEALEYGMPPAAGFGMSERLFAVLMDKPIREVVISPAMRKETGGIVFD